MKVIEATVVGDKVIGLVWNRIGSDYDYDVEDLTDEPMLYRLGRKETDNQLDYIFSGYIDKSLLISNAKTK